MDEPRRGLTTPEQLEAMKRELAEASDPRRLARLRKKRILKKIGVFILALLFICLAAVAIQIMIAKSYGRVKGLFGFYIYSVQTDAMAPALPSGSVILSRSPLYSPQVGPGAIVTFFDSNGERLTLRVTESVENPDGKTVYYVNGDNPQGMRLSEAIAPERIEAVFIRKIPFIR